MANRNEKKARVIIVKLNKVDFKTNSVTPQKRIEKAVTAKSF